MTRGEVLFNYNQAMAQARRLDTLAKQVELLSRNKIEDTKSRLRVAWQSDNSSAYLGKVEIVQNSIYDSAKKIRNIAQGISKSKKFSHSKSIKNYCNKQNKGYNPSFRWWNGWKFKQKLVIKQ